MLAAFTIAASVALSAPSTAQGGAAAASPGDPPRAATIVDEIATLVEQKFYSRALLAEVGWGEALAHARVAYAGAADAAAKTTVVRSLLATLATSHTAFYPRDDPAYWSLASIFEPVLAQTCAKGRQPSLPVSYDDIGVFWRQVGDDWFVAGIFAGSPAESAGLRVGDRVLAADHRPFAPVQSFAGRAGKPVRLEVQHERDGRPVAVEVVPRVVKPHEELRRASADSWRIIQHRGRRVAYVRLWTWTSVQIQLDLLDAIAKSNAESVDGFILDLRDGWGGAATHYLGMFFQEVPVLASLGGDGKGQSFDYQIRKPAVILINGGTRSGKETIAYGAKKHHLARLVGERTAGAVTAGQPFCLADGSLLLLAVADVRVDGERLEGRGVEPDLDVPFDFRFANGRDPQLARGLDEIAPAR